MSSEHLSVASTEAERPLLVLYATETGNAHDVAERITREAKRRYFHVKLANVEEYLVVSVIPAPTFRNGSLKYFSRLT